MPARCGITIGVTDIQLKTSNYVFSLVYAHRARGRVCRQPDRQRQRIGILAEPDRRYYRRRSGGWLFSLFGLIAVGTLGSLITSVAGCDRTVADRFGPDPSETGTLLIDV